jgi:4-aminobutyrate aminotransferase
MEAAPENVATHASPASGHLPGPRAAAIVARDDAVMSSSYTRSYPFVMARGLGARVWDPDGRAFLDMTAGIAVTSTGHAHPRVVDAIQQQAAKFIHMSGTDFYYDVEVNLAERLTALAPGDSSKRIFLTNSGTEAVEAALKLARWSTGRHRLLAFVGAFHGRTMGSLSLTASKPIQRARFGPFLDGVTHVPFPNPYRPPFGVAPSEAGSAVIDHIEHSLFSGPVPAEEVAAIFVEPILGEGGYIVPPADFLPALAALCKRHGILLVADEIQTGVGRTGKWWAVDHTGVVPDILTVAKGIASGMPLGAMIAPAEIMTWPPGAHGNTFGGNPLSCAAALATLDVIEEENLLANAATMGDRLMAGLLDMAKRHEGIGHVRGVGLMVAAELVADREGRAADPVLRDAIVDRAFHNGLLLLGAGKSSVRFMPPLNVTAAECDEALEILDRSMAEARATTV